MDFSALLQEAENRCLLLEDVAMFCANSAQPLESTLNNCALALAKAYSAGNASFDACDNLANVLFAFAADHGSIPDIMFSVYLALMRASSTLMRFVLPHLKSASLDLKLLKFSKDMPPSNIPVEAQLRRWDATPASRLHAPHLARKGSARFLRVSIPHARAFPSPLSRRAREVRWG